ncbi:MAG: sigma-70 family RNA polymerase sigma factor [Bacteroidota bacterium]
MQFSLTFNSSTLSSKTQSVTEAAMMAEWQQIQAAQQNPTQFRPLYDRYYEPIFRFIYRRTADESLAADLCSEVFFKALQKLNNYQFKGVPFSAWLYRIASNEITQHFRQTQKRRVVSVETNALPDLKAEMGDLDNFDTPQLEVSLIPALDQLKPKDLELVELRFFEQRPFKEIAQLLDITESNCKMRTYRVLGRLKKILMRSGSRD